MEIDRLLMLSIPLSVRGMPQIHPVPGIRPRPGSIVHKLHIASMAIAGNIPSMSRAMKRRSFLVGMLAGAVLALASVAGAAWLSEDEAPQYLRVVDDNYEHILGPNYEPEDGPMSARIIKNCKIAQFVVDLPQPDYAGSSFVKIDGMPKANLNCVIGEARNNSMSIAIVDGIDTTPTDCIGGWPTRFQKEEAGGFELCRGNRNPDPIFVPTPPPKR